MAAELPWTAWSGVADDRSQTVRSVRMVEVTVHGSNGRMV